MVDTTKNILSDYFLASAGRMTEQEFMGKHKISTLDFENKFAEENNVDIAGVESLTEINTKPEGVEMGYDKDMKAMAEGGVVDRDPVSGNEIPPGSTAEGVRDDIDVKVSEGEIVIPTDVANYYGVKFFENLRTKAKDALSDMEKEGRIGGEPSELVLEEVEKMALGGVVTGQDIEGTLDRIIEAVKTNPQIIDSLSKRGIGMAEGGIVKPFNASDWAAPGGGAFEQAPMSSQYEYVEYTGPDGATEMILHMGGVPAQVVPPGYVLSSQYTAPKASSGGSRGGSSSRGRTPSPMKPTNSAAPSGGGQGFSFGNPLSSLDFDDEESVENWASEKLNKNWMNRGMEMFGPLGQVASAGVEIRNVAEVNAAAKYYESIGKEDAAKNLFAMAEERREEMGFVGERTKDISSGESIFQNYANRNPANVVAPTPSRERDSRGSTKTNKPGLEIPNQIADAISKKQSSAPSESPRPKARRMSKGGLVVRPKK